MIIIILLMTVLIVRIINSVATIRKNLNKSTYIEAFAIC